MTIQIFIKTMSGRTLTLDVQPNYTILECKEMLRNREGGEGNLPVDKMILIHGGRKLQDARTLTDYRIGREATLHLILALKGMISTFTSNDSSDSLVKYLMLDDCARKKASIPLQQLREKSQSEGATSFATYKFSPTEASDILSREQRAKLSDFMEYMWHETSANAPVKRVDMRMQFVNFELFSLLINGSNADESQCENKLGNLFQEIPGASDCSWKVALRMTRGPSGACINFHCDGVDATRTVQLALNSTDEYEGGRLAYFVNDRLQVLDDRPAGSVVQHANRVLHGVTAMIKGTRKSLFLVDKSNGLGENGVVNVEDAHVIGFFETTTPQEVGSKRKCNSDPRKTKRSKSM